MHKLTLREIQLRELDMLVFFDKFCADNHLRYYLCGGSLLGAVRHKGFIPWDDDLDVCMPRPDYIRFTKLFCDTDKFRMVSDINGNYVRAYARIYDTQTEVKIPGMIKEGGPHLWLDILPVDGLPESDKKLRTLYKEVKFLRMIIYQRYASWKRGRNVFRKIFLPLPRLVMKKYGYKYALKKMHHIVAKYPYECAKYVGVLTWGLYGVGERMEKESFEKEVMVDFEGGTYPTFSCWKEYLTGIYGDYMKLPAKAKRQTHNVEAFVDG